MSKGSTYRPVNKKKFDENYQEIFRKDIDRLQKIGARKTGDVRIQAHYLNLCGSFRVNPVITRELTDRVIVNGDYNEEGELLGIEILILGESSDN